MIIVDNIEILRENIEKAKIRAGINHDVTIIGVTKTIEIDKIKEAISLGIKDIGENKVQELLRKQSEIKDVVNYHLIGALQSNKVRQIIGKTKLIHSLDRKSLLSEIDKRSRDLNVITDTLIQLNLSKEDTKSGLYKEELEGFIESVAECPNVRVRGLMAMGPFTEDKAKIRKVFRELYRIGEDLKASRIQNISVEFISMGMSGDYEIAVEEGANLIRVGQLIFGGREYK